MIRLFAGLDIPDDVADTLAGLQRGIPDARWTAHDNLHITLSFIGEVDVADVDMIHDYLEKIKSERFSLELSGINVFSRGNEPLMLYAGVTPNPALLLLKGRVDSALTRAGATVDHSKYIPHVTLARLRGAASEQVAAYIAYNNLFKAPAFKVSNFYLFESKVTETGAHYTVAGRYDL